jgi:hypothetical protein
MGSEEYDRVTRRGAKVDGIVLLALLLPSGEYSSVFRTTFYDYKIAG